MKSQEPKVQVTASQKNGKPRSVITRIVRVIPGQYWLAQKGAWALDQMNSV
jgi:hypothetical protein